MIVINDLSMQRGAKLLFHNVSLNMLDGKRYGIVGANGCGKSTFLELISKIESPSGGEIQIAKQKTIGWLKQDQFKYHDELILNVVLQGNQKLFQSFNEKEEILKKDNITEADGFRLAELEEIIAQNDGYTAESRAQKILSGLGLEEDKHFEALSSVSGGYKLRVLLAQALFENPDILLLDEPTNHLDIMTTQWLEQYLIEEYKGILLLISHDIIFLNKVSTSILDIDYGEIREYSGNYDFFVKQKQLVIEQKLHQKKHVEEKIAALQQYINRFGAKASKASQAQSKQKMLDKLEIPDIEKTSRLEPKLNFTLKRKSGKKVLSIDKLFKSYNDNLVLNNVSLDVKFKEKIAFVGHNGIGKSTLFKIIMNIVPQDNGKFEWGHETQISYFAQDHHEQLNKSQTVLAWISEIFPDVSEVNLRKALGRMLFTKDDINKNILNLSGGEGARLLLAKCMIEQPNVLVMDEPTNHLDIESINSLTKALIDYEGTLLLVSHDRYFVSNIANRIVALTETGLTNFNGTYNEFISDVGDDYLRQCFESKKFS